MALITEIIPQQGFEIVLYRIGAILLTEIQNQIDLQGLENSADIFIERQEPYDKSEDVVIIVSCNSASFVNQTQRGAQGDVSYYIDIYNRGYESATKSGSRDASEIQSRFLGMVRYIFNSTKYKTLGYEYGTIGGVYVTGFQKDDNYGNQEAAYIKFVRLNLTVRITEAQEMWNLQPFAGMDTTIRLHDTDKGYKLTFNKD